MLCITDDLEDSPAKPVQRRTLRLFDIPQVFIDVLGRHGAKSRSASPRGADDRTMYDVDSTEGIDAFDFDVESGQVGNRRRLVTLDPELGMPDGMTVDSAGSLWVAIWGGSKVHRYAPSGEFERAIHMPVSQVTSVAFGGPD